MNDVIDLARRVSEPKEPEDFWRQHTIKTILWPLAWRNADAGQPLKWEGAKFTRSNASKIPTTRGVYAFSISIKGTIIPPLGPIVYFGKATSLRQRFMDYIRERDRGSKRIRFGDIFKFWPNDIEFYFATISDINCSIDQVEKILNGEYQINQ